MRFLIVDDDAVCRELLRCILAPYGQCDLACDGREAVDAFRLALGDGNPYDLICLDIMMPKMNGHEALEEVRRIEREQATFGSGAVKIVMTTALKESRHCIQAFAEGCESYVTKPIKAETLLAEVRSLLGKLPAPRAPSSASQPRKSSGRLPGQFAATFAGARYLIVDDDRVCRELLKDVLSPFGRCDLAFDGREAIDAVRLALEDGEPYDMICLDIMMPDMNGHESLRAIRETEKQRGISGSDGVRVIMTTALRDSKHCVRSFREGCEHFITKPISQQELLDAMSELGLLEKVGA